MNYTNPEDFIQAIREALSSGNHTKAQQLSIEASEHYPDNEDIKKCAYILAPAKATVSKKNDIDREGLKKSREWVNQQRINRKYLNQWVAVQNGKLLAAANSVDELFDQVSDTKNVLFTVIY